MDKVSYKTLFIVIKKTNPSGETMKEYRSKRRNYKSHIMKTSIYCKLPL